MVADAVGVRGTEEHQVEIAEREQEPGQGEVCEGAPGTPGEEEFGEFEDGYEEGGGGAGAPSFGDDFEVAGEEFEAVEGEAAVVLRILVEGVAEGGDEVGVAAGSEDAGDFGGDGVGIADVFEDGITFDAGEQVGGEGELFGVGGDVHTGDGEEIEVDVTVDTLAGAADVEVPAAEGEILRLVGIEDEGGGREHSGTMP